MIVPKHRLLRPQAKFQLHEETAIDEKERAEWPGRPWYWTLLTLPDRYGAYRVFEAAHDRKAQSITFQVVVRNVPPGLRYDY